ncbi:MAG: sulfurtransferase TusA family protein [Nitrospiraceae bacterium]|nr:sulfurtransferase TusA family protein [Nitrospiraceae bacterium]
MNGEDIIKQFKFDLKLDCSGLWSPLPVIKVKKTLDHMSKGEILKITATDTNAENDMLGYLNSSGHEFIGKEEAEGEYFYYIKKAV